MDFKLNNNPPQRISFLNTFRPETALCNPGNGKAALCTGLVSERVGTSSADRGHQGSGAAMFQ